MTTPNNQPGGPGDFVGWDNTVTGDPLQIRHDANQPIDLYTNAIQRMRVHPNQSSTINGFPGIRQNGYVGISSQPLFFNNAPGPFSLLHLADSLSDLPSSYAPQHGYRPWMRNGMTITGNGHQSYIGQQYLLMDLPRDMVFQWSSPLGLADSRLRFIHTASYSSAIDTGSASLHGLEAMVMAPVDSYNVNIGIGDFMRVGATPEERLDVLDGRVRIRQLPTEAAMDSTVKVVAVNEDGVLGWLDASGVVTQDQAWLTAGNGSIVAGTHFLGTTTNVPLDIRTDSIHRARLLPDATYDIGLFTNQVKDGSLLLCPDVDQFYTNGAPGPYSLLHLADADDNASEASYREWMRVGIAFTGNLDQGYIGHKYNESDYTDMVVNWSDNTGKWLKDRLRFIFTTEYNAAPTGATSAEGLEGMRLYPLNDDEVNVGIGDFHAAYVNSSGAITEPAERLDVVDGRVRIRQLPTEDEADTLTQFVVVDPNGVLGWRTVPGGGSNCDWLVGQAPDDPHVTSVWSSGTCDWDNRHGVGIGMPVPKVKLHVYHDNDDLLDPVGIRGDVRLSPDTMTHLVGVWGSAGPQGGTVQQAWSIGTRGEAYTGNVNIGVHGIGRMRDTDIGTASVVMGVYGEGRAPAGNAGVGVGLYGVASGASTVNYGVVGDASGLGNWAGWFGGKVWVTDTAWVENGVYVISDGNLKTDVEDLSGGLEKVLQLSPKTYLFDQSVHPELGLPTGPQIGLIAQEVEQVVPEAVGSTRYPARIDTLGHITSEPFPVKGIDYTKLVPLLIGAVKEQQARIAGQDEHIAEQQAEVDELQEQLAAQDARLAQIEQALAACCATPANTDQRMRIEDTGAVEGVERNLRIVPNPFSEGTTVYYTLEKGGRMQLLANSADGKQLRVLTEATLEAGQYQYDWSTMDLGPGIYYVTLLLDGEPIVKKAVKVAR